MTMMMIDVMIFCFFIMLVRLGEDIVSFFATAIKIGLSFKLNE